MSDIEGHLSASRVTINRARGLLENALRGFRTGIIVKLYSLGRIACTALLWLKKRAVRVQKSAFLE